MEFRPYQYGDLVQLVSDENLRAIITDQHLDPKAAWTLVDKKIIACGGFVLLWPGVYEAWIHVATPDIFISYKVCLIKRIRQEIDKLEYHRLQATVSVKTPNHEKFMKLLGFHYEGILSQYGLNKENYIMYARIRE